MSNKGRGKSIGVWFGEEDYAELAKKVSSSGLSQSRFIKMAALGYKLPQSRVAADPVLLRQLARIQNHIFEMLRVLQAYQSAGGISSEYWLCTIAMLADLMDEISMMGRRT